MERPAGIAGIDMATEGGRPTIPHRLEDLPLDRTLRRREGVHGTPDATGKVREVEIHGRGMEAGVAQKLLDLQEGRPVFQKVSGKTMAQG